MRQALSGFSAGILGDEPKTTPTNLEAYAGGYATGTVAGVLLRAMVMIGIFLIGVVIGFSGQALP
jgi:hypothetical protein